MFQSNWLATLAVTGIAATSMLSDEGDDSAAPAQSVDAVAESSQLAKFIEVEAVEEGVEQANAQEFKSKVEVVPEQSIEPRQDVAVVQKPQVDPLVVPDQSNKVTVPVEAKPRQDDGKATLVVEPKGKNKVEIKEVVQPVVQQGLFADLDVETTVSSTIQQQSTPVIAKQPVVSKK